MINVSVHLLDDDHPVIGAVGLLLQLERVPLDDNAAARDQDHIHRAHLHNGLSFKECIYIYKNAKSMNIILYIQLTTKFEGFVHWPLITNYSNPYLHIGVVAWVVR